VQRSRAANPEKYRQARQRWQERNPEKRRESARRLRVRGNQQGKAWLARKQANTRKKATRHGEPWTPAEIAIALDPNRTVTEAAQDLGRTYYAVRLRRHCTRRALAGNP
jgi:hypothetical protein